MHMYYIDEKMIRGSGSLGLSGSVWWRQGVGVDSFLLATPPAIWKLGTLKQGMETDHQDLLQSLKKTILSSLQRQDIMIQTTIPPKI